MRVHIMGSAAAEGWPAIWCGCTHCQKARQLGGKNIRTRSGALLDGTIKIDLCTDTFMQALRDGLDLSAVTDLLITHAHGDHLTPFELGMHRPPFAHDNATMHVWGGQKAIELAKAGVGKWANHDERLHTLQPFVEATLSDGTRVMPLEAAHDPASTPLNYIIHRQGKAMLYGMDSGWYPERSWEAHSRFVFDVVLIDCTLGNGQPARSHGTLAEAIAIRQRMLEAGTAHANTVFVANHFSHNGGLTHEEMEAYLAGSGITVGYDGLVVEV